MIIKISNNEYHNFIDWAERNTANRVYPLSIAQGFQRGDIYVNSGAEVQAVLFWHYCGFGYISGIRGRIVPSFSWECSDAFLKTALKCGFEPDRRTVVIQKRNVTESNIDVTAPPFTVTGDSVYDEAVKSKPRGAGA